MLEDAGFEIAVDPLKVNWRLTDDTQIEAFELGKTLARESKMGNKDNL